MKGARVQLWFLLRYSLPAGFDCSNSPTRGIPYDASASDAILDGSCSAALGVPYYQPIA
jgi:hypothetical protein